MRRVPSGAWARSIGQPPRPGDGPTRLDSPTLCIGSPRSAQARAGLSESQLEPPSTGVRVPERLGFAGDRMVELLAASTGCQVMRTQAAGSRAATRWPRCRPPFAIRRASEPPRDQPALARARAIVPSNDSRAGSGHRAVAIAKARRNHEALMKAAIADPDLGAHLGCRRLRRAQAELHIEARVLVAKLRAAALFPRAPLRDRFRCTSACDRALLVSSTAMPSLRRAACAATTRDGGQSGH